MEHTLVRSFVRATIILKNHKHAAAYQHRCEGGKLHCISIKRHQHPSANGKHNSTTGVPSPYCRRAACQRHGTIFLHVPWSSSSSSSKRYQQVVSASRSERQQQQQQQQQQEYQHEQAAVAAAAAGALVTHDRNNALASNPLGIHTHAHIHTHTPTPARCTARTHTHPD